MYYVSYNVCYPQDNKQLMEGLKNASAMLTELRTSLLSPKSYYELCIQLTVQVPYKQLLI